MSEIKNSPKKIRQIIAEKDFRNVFTFCQEYNLLLVHALPDYNETKAISGVRRDFDREMTFEDALDGCKLDIPNLCCSTVKENDQYNRYGGNRFFGVFVLGGQIVEAYHTDAMSYRKNNFEKVQITKEEIEISVKNKKGKFNEINIDTRYSNFLPYFDLDCLFRGVSYGVNTPYGWSNPNTLISDLFRYELAMKKHKLPFIGLFRGRAVKFDIHELRNYLDNFPKPVDDIDYDNFCSKKDELNNYLTNLKKILFVATFSFIKI